MAGDVITRRGFCRAATATAIGLLLPMAGCATTSVFRTSITDGRVRVPFDRIVPADEAEGSVVVYAEGLPDPILVMRINAEYRAVSARCTHLGCTVRLSGSQLQCPCHGSTYALDGSVIRGPAQAPLTRIPVEVTWHGVDLQLGESPK